MKIIGTDNLNRESVADVLIAENVHQWYGQKIVDLLNKEANIGDSSGTWYKVVDDGYRLSRGMEDLI